jgi:hypothetical protein
MGQYPPLRYVGDPLPPPKHEWRTDHLYSTKQTPRGSVVVLGDQIISEHEMPTATAQQQADWLNHRRKTT